MDNTKLEYLIAKAQKYKMTDEDRSVQVRSFAYGNTHFENHGITKAHIDQAVESLRAEREPQS